MRNICLRIIAGMIAVAAAAAFAVSCTADPHGGEEEAPEGEGYISVSLSVGNGGPSSRGDVVLDPGSLSERYVYDVRVLLFGTGDELLKYVFNFQIRTTDDGAGFEEYTTDGGFPPVITPGLPEGAEKQLDHDSSGADYFVTWARKVTKASYDMLVLINTPGEGAGGYGDMLGYVRNFEYGGQVTLSEVMQPMLIESFAINYWVAYPPPSYDYYYGLAAEKFFMMSNHQGLVRVDAADIYDSVAAANASPVEVEVSRAVAKVTLDTKYNTSVADGASVVFLDWELDCMNRFTYPVRHPANLLQDGGGKGAAETPGDGSARKNQYADDPNFSGYGFAAGATDAQREAQFAYSYKRTVGAVDVVHHKDDYNSYESGLPLPIYLASTPENLTPALLYTYDRSAEAKPVYCLENTFDLSDQSEEVMTAVMVRAKYIPAGYAEDDSYFVFNSQLISVTQMAAFADDPSAVGNYNGLDGLEEAMTAAGLTDSSVVTGLAQSFSSEGISYFHQGINYYRIPIRHHTDETLDPALGTEYYGYYGVVRNNHYTVAIGTVNGPGKPTAKPEPEPENPINPVISVMAWGDKELNFDL